MVSGSYDEPSKLIKNYELLPTVEKIKALKATMLKVMHDAGDFTEITEPSKLTVEHIGCTLPVKVTPHPSFSPSGIVLLENTRKYDSILINENDEHRILAYANRGYEIAGTVSGRIIMRKAL
jgi:hypothetical protein